MHLLPKPKILTLNAGFSDAPMDSYAIFAKATRLHDAFERLGCHPNQESPSIEVHLNSGQHRQSDWHRLDISKSRIRISAKTEAGAFAGIETLRQIRKQHPDKLPCLEIEDWPELPERGFMLDISRCRVPTQAALRDLVDQLAALKYNQLQLYTEHTFAYSEHRTVWQDADPMTAEQIRSLDQYCHERFVELVPNQNSFGHMERWLRHAPYQRLAECPGGFEHPHSGWKDHGSTMRPTQESADFVAELFRELLPNFRSNRVNIGGDEPWELGQGYSRRLVAEQGKQVVYTEHLNRILYQITSNGKRAQFWGDIAMNDPLLASEMSTCATALLWGYEADHPFHEQCKAMKAVSMPFCVVPGTSTWNSIGGRAHTALPNISKAAEAAKASGAAGLLLCEWGDNGHHQSHLPRLLPMLHAAAAAWSEEAKSSELALAATELLPHSIAKEDFSAIISLSEAANSFSTHLHNESWLNKLLFARPDRYAEVSDAIAIGELECARELLCGISGSEPLMLARDLLLYAADKGLQVKRGKRPDAFPAELVKRQREDWLASSRPGGLEESLRHLPS